MPPQRVLRIVLVLTSIVYMTAKAHAVSYYVDCDKGRDTNNGTATNRAWQTVARVSLQTFSAGDNIFLKAGNTCSYIGQLYPKGSGATGSPIRIDKYGTGANPVVSANGTGLAAGSHGAIYLHNQSHWEIRNLVVTNCLLSSGVCVGAQGNWNNQTLRAQLIGIEVVNDGGGQLNHIYIGGNTVQYVSGTLDLLPPNGPCAGNCPWMNGGIVVASEFRTTPASRFDDITIENNTITHVDSGAISVVPLVNFTGYDGMFAVAGATPNTNIIIRNNALSDVGQGGVLLFVTSNSTITNNVLHDGGVRLGGPGIMTAAASWTDISYNEIYNWGLTNIGPDRYAIDVDWGSLFATVQYNYSHGNSEGFLEVWETHQEAYHNGAGALVCDSETAHSDGLNVRWNISVNDGPINDTGVILFCGGGRDAGYWPCVDNNAVANMKSQVPYGPHWPLIANNTILLDSNAHVPIIKQCAMPGPFIPSNPTPNVLQAVGYNGNRDNTVSLAFYNNIIYAQNAPLNGELSWTQAIHGSIFDYNTLYGTFSNGAPGYCSGSPNISCSYSVYCPSGQTCVTRPNQAYRNPLMVNPWSAVNGNYAPIGRSNLAGMKLQTGSSELGGGCNPYNGSCGAWSWITLGNSDFWGYPVVINANPNRGAYNGPGM